MKWFKQNWLILLILVASIVLRVYRINDTMTFLEDEGRDLLIAKRMIDTGRPVLLGPQTSTGNMYLGPLYYYFITPALALAGMNPVGPAILIALSGVLTTYLLFVLGKKWFSTNAGYLAATLFAILPFSVLVTRASWNPNLVPLITVFMLLVYDRLVYQRATAKLWFAYGALIGVMVQLHYMALIFCGALTLLILYHFRTKVWQVVKGGLIALIGFVLLISPFIIFELRNDFVNTHAITRFVVAKEDQTLRYKMPLWLWWGKVSQVSYRLVGKTLSGSELGAQPLAPYVVGGYLLGFVSTLIVALKQKDKIYLSLGALILISLSVVGVYQEYVHLHYLEFGIPILILALSGMVKPKTPKLLGRLSLIFIFAVAIIGFIQTIKYIGSGETHQVRKSREVAEYIVQKAAGQPYNVVSTQGTYTTPFQYFLAISENPPVNTIEKRVFDICAGEPCPEDDETTTLLFLTGPGHPSIAQYLGHPEMNSFSGKRRMVSNEHVSIGIWVAEIVLE